MYLRITILLLLPLLFACEGKEGPMGSQGEQGIQGEQGNQGTIDPTLAARIDSIGSALVALRARVDGGDTTLQAKLDSAENRLNAIVSLVFANTAVAPLEMLRPSLVR